MDGGALVDYTYGGDRRACGNFNLFLKKNIYVGPFCKEGDGCVLYTFGFRAFAGEFLFYRIRKRIAHFCIKIEERVFTTR